MRPQTLSFVIKPTVFVAALLPLVYLVWLIKHDGLGIDPAKALVDFLGLWALRFLWITLAVTPARLLTGQAWVLRLRRMLGLYTLFYAVLHMLGYLFFILQWQWSELADDIIKRPYMLVGFTALLLMLPLGLTSFNAAIKKLGRRWHTLHRLIYAIALLALLHFFWVARSDITEQIIYAVVLAALFLIRIIKKTHATA